MNADAAGETAPAKVNLYLHLRGRRADGYHLLDSLAVFPSIGDRLSAAPDDSLSLRITGPFAAGLSNADDNLVLKAVRALAQAHGIAPNVALTLEKNLPVASGIGGGSSDAAAALRLLSRQWSVAVPDGLALGLGADVPVCLRAPNPQFMGGIGEVLRPGCALPPHWMVLVNPAEAVETRAVFAAVASRDNPPAPPPPEDLDFSGMIEWLGAQRNDLQAPAQSICPAIGAALDALAGAPLARMSGSGATCFALHESEAAARAHVQDVKRRYPNWWVATGRVQGRDIGDGFHAM